MEILLLDVGSFVSQEPRVSKLPPAETGMAMDPSCRYRTGSVLPYTGCSNKAT